MANRDLHTQPTLKIKATVGGVEEMQGQNQARYKV